MLFPLVLALLAGAASPAFSQWRFVPEIRVVGGDESDLVIDPGLTRTIVPGGVFIEVTPTIAARRWIGRDALIDLGTFATLQKFFNSESRFLYAQTVWGDIYQSFGKNFRGRLSASLDFFDDSERDTVRRLGAGGEVGIMYMRPRWSTELWGGGRGRRYPNITIQDTPNQTSTYTEATWTGGATLRLTPVERFSLRADGVLQNTDSSDPYYNSVAATGFGSADIRLVSSWFLTVSGTYQERDFSERAAGEETDEYWQVGAGLRYVFAPGWTATARYGYADYTWPDGNSHDTHRLAIGFNYVWGRRNAPPPTVRLDALTQDSGGAIQQPDAAGNVHLRIQAPNAVTVAVAGGFNDWNPDANPLRKGADGWWETRLELGPGTYEYIYIIDGEWTTPPESKLTVDDGFGGSNGILEVLPAGL
jgi:opacity protein-like surface antigen